MQFVWQRVLGEFLENGKTLIADGGKHDWDGTLISIRYTRIGSGIFYDYRELMEAT